jgi:hypothetical protein
MLPLYLVTSGGVSGLGHEFSMERHLANIDAFSACVSFISQFAVASTFNGLKFVAVLLNTFCGDMEFT